MKTKLIIVAIGFAAGYFLKNKLSTLPVFSTAYGAGAQGLS
jgi:hypothetical protein